MEDKSCLKILMVILATVVATPSFAQLYVVTVPDSKKTKKAIANKGVTVHIGHETIKALQDQGKPFSIYLKIGKDGRPLQYSGSSRAPSNDKLVQKTEASINEVKPPLSGHQFFVSSGFGFTKISGDSRVNGSAANVLSDLGYNLGLSWKKELWEDWFVMTGLSGSQYSMNAGTNSLLNSGREQNLSHFSAGMKYEKWTNFYLSLMADYSDKMYLQTNGNNLSVGKEALPSFTMAVRYDIIDLEAHELFASFQGQFNFSSENMESGNTILGSLGYSYKVSRQFAIGAVAELSDRNQDTAEFNQDQKELSTFLYIHRMFGIGGRL